MGSTQPARTIGALTLHHGNAEASYVEHPLEVARRALRDAAAIEPSDAVRAALLYVAQSLPTRGRTVLSQSTLAAIP